MFVLQVNMYEFSPYMKGISHSNCRDNIMHSRASFLDTCQSVPPISSTNSGSSRNDGRTRSLLRSMIPHALPLSSGTHPITELIAVSSITSEDDCSILVYVTGPSVTSNPFVSQVWTMATKRWVGSEENKGCAGRVKRRMAWSWP